MVMLHFLSKMEMPSTNYQCHKGGVYPIKGHGGKHNKVCLYEPGGSVVLSVLLISGASS